MLHNEWTKVKSYIVTEIEFDFDDNDESYGISYEEQIAMQDNVLGIWFAYDDEHLIDKISDTFEFCIKSINFELNRPHALTFICDDSFNEYLIILRYINGLPLLL